jgi:hypothetical protein
MRRRSRRVTASSSNTLPSMAVSQKASLWTMPSWRKCPSSRAATLEAAQVAQRAVGEAGGEQPPTDLGDVVDVQVVRHLEPVERSRATVGGVVAVVLAGLRPGRGRLARPAGAHRRGLGREVVAVDAAGVGPGREQRVAAEEAAVEVEHVHRAQARVRDVEPVVDGGDVVQVVHARLVQHAGHDGAGGIDPHHGGVRRDVEQAVGREAPAREALGRDVQVGGRRPAQQYTSARSAARSTSHTTPSPPWSK